MKQADKVKILNRLSDVQDLILQAKDFLDKDELDEAESAVDEALDELTAAAATLTNEIDADDERKPKSRVMHQFDDTEASTRKCPCGDWFTWSGVDDRLKGWMAAHRDHYDELKISSKDDGA